MAGLPKSIIKKYGVTKKAWQVYRGGKTSSKRRRVQTMAKKRRKGGRKGSSGGMLGGLSQPAYGAVGAVLYDSLISPMIPLNGTAKDVAELGLGLYASKKGGVIGATGKTLVVLNMYQLISRIKGAVGNGTMNGNNNLFDGGGF